MSQYLQIHPETPQSRLVNQVVALLHRGGVIVYPTDSGYALGCQIGDKAALDKIRRIRELDDKHDFTLMCRDLSELANYARVDNAAFRLIRNATPGPYTFVLRATNEVPRRLLHPKKKTIGIRVPDNAIAQALLEALGEPLMNASLVLPSGDDYLLDPDEIYEQLENRIDLMINGGFCPSEPTTVVDLTSGYPEVLRRGAGDPDRFE